MPAVAEVETPPPPSRLGRRLSCGVLLGLVLALTAEAYRVLLGNNFHAVRPGLVYRCAQQDGPGLERLVRAHHIRTVVNLRGCNVILPWYQEECRATHRLDVNQEDLCMSAGRLPATHELRRLLELLDRAEYPLLLHCRRGADRTGLVSAVVVLLQTDATLGQARRQIGPRYGHVALGRPGYLDQFLTQYEAWLRDHDRTHTPARFRRWVEEDYLPAGYRAALEPQAVPAALAAGRPAGVRVRARNTGTSTWHLCPESTAGVHLRAVLTDQAGREVWKGRSGLFRAAVTPGDAVDLTVALPGLPPGNYRLFVDLMDEQQLCFFQGGSEPWQWEFEARDQAAATARERHAVGLAGLAH